MEELQKYRQELIDFSKRDNKMKYLKIFALISCLSLSACHISYLPTEKINNLKDLNQELKKADEALKQRQQAYKKQGNNSAALQVSSHRGTIKAASGIVGDTVNSSKKVLDIPKEIIQQSYPFFPAPYGVIVQAIGGLLALGGTGYGIKKAKNKFLDDPRAIADAQEEIQLDPQLDGVGKINYDCPKTKLRFKQKLTKKQFKDLYPNG